MKKKLLLIPLIALLTTGCNVQPIDSNSSTPSNESQEVQPDFHATFEISDDYQGMFDTQTATQKGYMEDEYTNIDKYGKGSSDSSGWNGRPHIYQPGYTDFYVWR